MMYHLVFAFLRLLSRLPFWVLHRISDGLFLLMYYIIGYRRKVILQNLQIAFPEHSLAENKKIARKFVHQFADFLVESLKTLTISEKQLHKRYVYINEHLLEEDLKNGKSLMMVAGHFINWEWLFYFGKITKVLTWAAYSPLSNPIFDRLMVANRERYGFKVIPSKKTAEALRRFYNEKTQHVNCLMADQSPKADYKYRTVFLGKDVPFFMGPEAYAKKYNMPVYYGRIRRVKRSYYTVEVVPITNTPSETEQGWITSEYVRLIEGDIKAHPENYLWSHRRFKHVR